MALIMILGLYLGIGVAAAIGTVAITRSRFSAKAEQIFFGLLFVPIAVVYVAFTDYFAADAAWQYETIAVICFAASGLLGIRLPAFLILGYALHGAWDLLHEVVMHSRPVAGEAGTLTAIPLAYGVFCAAYDWCVAGYFYTRREQWNAAWSRS